MKFEKVTKRFFSLVQNWRFGMGSKCCAYIMLPNIIGVMLSECVSSFMVMSGCRLESCLVQRTMLDFFGDGDSGLDELMV